jgi:hypothetical protein
MGKNSHGGFTPPKGKPTGNGRESTGLTDATQMNGRYNAFIYIDKTTALHPLHLKADGCQVPETYPFNF